MNVKKEFEKYAKACYGSLKELSVLQRKETEQAFLSGMHFVLTESDTSFPEMARQVRKRLMEIGSFPIEDN